MIVFGAGSRDVNGEYFRFGTDVEGYPQYEHDFDPAFVLQRRTNQRGEAAWVLREERDEYSRVLYRTRPAWAKVGMAALPPQGRGEWLAEGGSLPAPCVELQCISPTMAFDLL